MRDLLCGFSPKIFKEPARAALAHRMGTSVEGNFYEEGKLTSYCQLVNYVLEAYASSDVIAEAEGDITNYKQPENMSAVRYSQAFLEKALLCGQVYSESKLKGFFKEERYNSIGFSMRNFFGANQEASLQNLAELGYLPI